MEPLLILGLGNPGKKYDGTRHNIGKDWLIKISKQFFKKFNTKTKFEAEIGESHNNELLWSIPTNYMNDSGKTIFKILKSTKLMLMILIAYIKLNPTKFF